MQKLIRITDWMVEMTENEQGSSESMLSVENITLSFGAVRAIRDVSFDIKRGEIRAIIGPNGAGENLHVKCH
jgi:branched-chain amino acid transport system ATP-binding protein